MNLEFLKTLEWKEKEKKKTLLMLRYEYRHTSTIIYFI